MPRSAPNETKRVWYPVGDAYLGRLVCEYCSHTDRALVRPEGERLVCASALAGGQQLHPEVGDQPIGDVAGGNLRSRANRQGTRLGRSPGHEHDARFSPRSAVAAGRPRFSPPPRPVPDHRRAPSHPPAVRAFRFLLGPAAAPRPAACSGSRRAQLRLGAESRGQRAGRSYPVSAPERVRAGCRRSVRHRRPHPWLGRSGTSPDRTPPEAIPRPSST